jgi:hypothetical protein
MKFSMLEKAKERMQAYKIACKENEEKRVAAKKGLETARAEEQALIERSLEGDEVIKELGEAQARIKIAEAKCRRVIEEIGEKNPEMDLKGITFNSVQSEFNSYGRNGLQEDMKDELAELKKVRDQYLASTEKVLTKFYELRKELRDKIIEAEDLFGRDVTGTLPNGFSESLLRSEGLWWSPNDAHSTIQLAGKKARENVEGKPYLPPSRPSTGVQTKPASEISTEKYYTDENGVRWERQSVGFEKVTSKKKGHQENVEENPYDPNWINNPDNKILPKPKYTPGPDEIQDEQGTIWIKQHHTSGGRG